ncbi:MAG: FHA domain-containing protein [Chloroflexi bacterium CFX4]|nr:FHA domain-containing protein [Chloroflexi bacterium CFX4]MDL1921562.1 FHA domain-containing protein [Chloroflexi bacterium CFX3]
MPQDVILFALRMFASLLLLTFFGAVMVMLWRDFRTASAEVDTRTRKRGRLIVIGVEDGGTPSGKSYPLLPLTSLGRAPTNTVILEDSFASGEHALITLRDGQWWLEDRGSSNGTLLNGYLVEEPVVLSTGDVIAVGRIALKLELDS